MRKGPLSFSQELLFAMEKLQGSAPVVSRAVQLTGDLDVEAFAAAAIATMTAHEPLRSIWVWEDGVPVSLVLEAEATEPCFHFEDRTSEMELALHLNGRVALGAKHAPQMRHRLSRVADQTYIWSVGAHHMATDAFSMRLYGETFSRSYASEGPEMRCPTTSIDYALAQRNWLNSAQAQAQFEWWLSHVNGVAPTLLPVRPAQVAPVDGRERQEVRCIAGGRAIVSKCAREWRVPLAAILLGAFARTISARLLVDQVVVFSHLPGRSLPGGSIATGALYNTLPIVIPIVSSDYQSLSLAAAQALYDALDHQEVPISLVSLAATRGGAEALSSRIPMSFNVADHPLASFRLPGCTVRDIDLESLNPLGWGATKHALPSSSANAMDWLVTVLPSAVVLAVEYDAARCDAHDVYALIDEFRLNLLASIGIDDIRESGDPSLIVDWTASTI